MNSLSTNNINDIESNLNFYDVIKNLKYEERIIVVLYYMEDYSVKEIKDILKMNENTIDFAEKIKNALNLKDKYKLDSINEISSFSESNDEKKVWYAKFNQYNNEIDNPNIYLDMYFYVKDNSMRIEQILCFNNVVQFGYNYDNNEIKISKDDALKIALDKNKEISNLPIKTTEVSLEVRDMNAFVYAQENSNGVSDEIAYFESEENSSIESYDKYEDSHLLRNVWNVKVVYEIESKDNVNTWKENFCRNYYIDATTGEVIGGSWGENWNG